MVSKVTFYIDNSGGEPRNTATVENITLPPTNEQQDVSSSVSPHHQQREGGHDKNQQREEECAQKIRIPWDQFQQQGHQPAYQVISQNSSGCDRHINISEERQSYYQQQGVRGILTNPRNKSDYDNYHPSHRHHSDNICENKEQEKEKHSAHQDQSYLDEESLSYGMNEQRGQAEAGVRTTTAIPYSVGSSFVAPSIATSPPIAISSGFNCPPRQQQVSSDPLRRHDSSSRRVSYTIDDYHRHGKEGEQNQQTKNHNVSSRQNTPEIEQKHHSSHRYELNVQQSRTNCVDDDWPSERRPATNSTLHCQKESSPSKVVSNPAQPDVNLKQEETDKKNVNLTSTPRIEEERRNTAISKKANKIDIIPMDKKTNKHNDDDAPSSQQNVNCSSNDHSPGHESSITKGPNDSNDNNNNNSRNPRQEVQQPYRPEDCQPHYCHKEAYFKAQPSSYYLPYNDRYNYYNHCRNNYYYCNKNYFPFHPENMQSNMMSDHQWQYPQQNFTRRPYDSPKTNDDANNNSDNLPSLASSRSTSCDNPSGRGGNGKKQSEKKKCEESKIIDPPNSNEKISPLVNLLNGGDNGQGCSPKNDKPANSSLSLPLPVSSAKDKIQENPNDYDEDSSSDDEEDELSNNRQMADCYNKPNSGCCCVKCMSHSPKYVKTIITSYKSTRQQVIMQYHQRLANSKKKKWKKKPSIYRQHVGSFASILSILPGYRQISATHLNALLKVDSNYGALYPIPIKLRHSAEELLRVPRSGPVSRKWACLEAKRLARRQKQQQLIELGVDLADGSSISSHESIKNTNGSTENHKNNKDHLTYQLDQTVSNKRKRKISNNLIPFIKTKLRAISIAEMRSRTMLDDESNENKCCHNCRKHFIYGGVLVDAKSNASKLCMDNLHSKKYFQVPKGYNMVQKEHINAIVENGREFGVTFPIPTKLDPAIVSNVILNFNFGSKKNPNVYPQRKKENLIWKTSD